MGKSTPEMHLIFRGVYPYPKMFSSWPLFCVMFSQSDEDSTCQQRNVQLTMLTRSLVLGAIPSAAAFLATPVLPRRVECRAQCNSGDGATPLSETSRRGGQLISSRWTRHRSCFTKRAPGFLSTATSWSCPVLPHPPGRDEGLTAAKGISWP